MLLLEIEGAETGTYLTKRQPLARMERTAMLYEFGYGGREVNELLTMQKELDALVIDTRFSPFSKNSEWNITSLRRVLGSRIENRKGLGNANYKSYPVKLNDPAKDVTDICNRLRAGQNVILMCVCRRDWACHRREVRRLIEREMGWTVSAPTVEEPPDSAKRRSHRETPVKRTAKPTTLDLFDEI